MATVEAIWRDPSAQLINFHLIFRFTFALSWGITLLAAPIGSNVKVYVDA